MSFGEIVFNVKFSLHLYRARGDYARSDAQLPSHARDARTHCQRDLTCGTTLTHDACRLGISKLRTAAIHLPTISTMISHLPVSVTAGAAALSEITPIHITERDMVADPLTKYLKQVVWARHMKYGMNYMYDYSH
jgi:hypothetical protein